MDLRDENLKEINYFECATPGWQGSHLLYSSPYPNQLTADAREVEGGSHFSSVWTPGKLHQSRCTILSSQALALDKYFT
jgi:hypothetical protein